MSAEAATTIEPEKPALRASAPRFHQLDGMRTVAVLLVMFHHAFSAKLRGALSIWYGQNYLGDLLYNTTASGVELFFVLSGVVLLRPYLRGAKKLELGTYAKRRIERLWPPFLVALAIEVLFSLVNDHFRTWYSPDRTFRMTIPGVLFQLPIVHFNWQYFDPNWRIYNSAWWSLTVEVLFYIVVPLLIPIFAAVWMDRKTIALTILFSAMMGAVANSFVEDQGRLAMDEQAQKARLEKLSANQSDAEKVLLKELRTRSPIKHQSFPWDPFLLLLGYSQCFLLGIAIAKFDWTARQGTVLMAFGALYLLVSMKIQELNFHIGYGLLYGGMVMLAFQPRGKLNYLLTRPIMIWTGERSYSLFLIHFTAYGIMNYSLSYFFADKTLAWGIASRLSGIVLAFLGAMLMFQFVERRFARNLVTAGAFWPRWSKL